MKRFGAILLALLLIIGTASAETLYFSADLHWGDEAPDAELILDAMLSPKHEVLLLLGDLTNNGHLSEHQALIERLKAGARVYVLPGNHDLTTLSADEFAALYADFGYNEAFSRDDASASYAVKLSDTLWLAMLDSCAQGEASGVFRAETEVWLDGVLSQSAASGACVVVALHHPLLSHSYNDKQRTDNVENGDRLTALLRRYGVQVVLAGHRHISHIAQENGLTELLIGTPTAWPNKIGRLTIDASEADFATEVLDVERVGFADEAYARLLAQAQSMATGALADTSHVGDEAMIDFFAKVFTAYRNGTLASVRAELLSDPAYLLWQDEEIKSIFRPWLSWLLHDITSDLNALRIPMR